MLCPGFLNPGADKSTHWGTEQLHILRDISEVVD
jgi:hypothetical protein